MRREARGTEQQPPVRTVVQAPLDLRSPAPLEKKQVGDDASVASSGVRLQGAILDLAIIAAGTGLAALAFHWTGGRFQWAARAAAPYLGAVLALAAFYHLFWAVLGRETPGNRSLGLRVLTFDGRPPSWTRRTVRFGLLCLGIVAVGVGPLWALIDEEGLAIHDHMSKTFPTRYDPHPSTLRRR